MLVDLTPEQIVDFAEITFFRHGETTFQIAGSGETPISTRLIHTYKMKIGDKTVLIYSNLPLLKRTLAKIVKNPFKFVDEHPFRH